jgi:adenylate kinase family enzyme
MPIVDHFERLGLVKKVDTNRPVSEIFDDIKTLFSAQI